MKYQLNKPEPKKSDYIIGLTFFIIVGFVGFGILSAGYHILERNMKEPYTSYATFSSKRQQTGNPYGLTGENAKLYAEQLAAEPPAASFKPAQPPTESATIPYTTGSASTAKDTDNSTTTSSGGNANCPDATVPVGPGHSIVACSESTLPAGEAQY
jgi:hypothetical protein